MPTFPNATHYSKHFTRKELDCHCGCPTPPEVQRELAILAGHLEELRELAGRPLSPNCGHRCRKQNRRVGGAPASFHMKGQAGDIDCLGSAKEVDHLAQLAELVPAFRAAGIGRYYNEHGFFVHVDFGSRFWRGVET